MAAICGLLGPCPTEDDTSEAFARMLRALGARGEGAPAVLVDRHGELRMGVRARRADSRATVHTSEDGALSMVCDGQVFNHAEVTAWLRSRNHAPGGGDTGELLLHLFEEEGADGLRRADGQFAFALWDRPRHRLVLGRDGLGVHPLYYRAWPRHLAFASAARALLAHPGVGASVDEVGVAHYLTFLSVPGPRTLLAGVSKLPPGHVAVVDAGGAVTLRRYWDLLDEPIPERDDEAFYVERVRELHRQAVEHRSVDGPIAVLLSGGNDSSANAAVLARRARGPLHTFTVGLRETEGRPDFSDLAHARRVAALVGSVHHEALLSVDEFLATIDVTVSALDDLVSEPSSVFLHHALRLVKDQGLEVVVAGDANDEVSCGHREMIRIRNGYYRRWAPYMRLPAMVRRAGARLGPLLSPQRRDVLARAARGQAYFWSFEIGWPESQIDAILASRAAAADGSAAAAVERVVARLRAAERRRDYLDDIIYTMMQDHYLGNLMLGKLDLLAAQLGLEARCPYAALPYAHFVFNIPAPLKTRNGTVKYFFKRAIADLLPREVIDRPKQGFRTPTGELFRGALGEWARPHLYEEGLTRAGLLRRATIERVMAEHRAGGVDHSTKLWTLLVLNLWHERWIRGVAVLLLLLLAVAGRPAPSHADTLTVTAGQTLALTGDVVLGERDVVAALGTADAPCLLLGNGHGIRAPEGWTGRIVIRHCTLRGLGSAGSPALDVLAAGQAEVIVEDTAFDASGAIVLRTAGESTVTFRRNTILESSVVPTEIPLARSRPAFSVSGSSPAAKMFQGNRIYRSWAEFDASANWTVGGDTPAESNIIIGNRAGIIIRRSRQMTVRGNYVRGTGPFVGWNQVSTFQADGSEILVEHNVIRGGNWLVRAFAGGELRYNLIGDSFDRPWIILQSDGQAAVHHNVFMRNETHPGVDGVWVLYAARAPSTRVYSNTFHGGGDCGVRTGGAVSVHEGSFLASLHSNAFVGFRADLGPETAIVRGNVMPYGREPKSLYPPRLGYADYNLFFNPHAAIRDNYALSVAGKTERQDPGFARFDATPGGPVDQQVDPRFTGPIPVVFPYPDEDLKSGAATVCQILRFYRRIFTPRPDSPLVDRGDPQDGAGADIGAVGAGTPHPDDRFGTLCPGDDVGTPRVSPTTYACR